MGLIGGLRKETFFFSLIGPIFSDRITLLKMKRRALFPREFVARSIGRSCARGGPRTPTQSPSKWSCARCTRCSRGPRVRGLSNYSDKRERCGEPLENNRVSALWKKRKRENNGEREGKGKRHFRDGNFSGNREDFSLERTNNKLEQVGTTS